MKQGLCDVVGLTPPKLKNLNQNPGHGIADQAKALPQSGLLLAPVLQGAVVTSALRRVSRVRNSGIGVLFMGVESCVYQQNSPPSFSSGLVK